MAQSTLRRYSQRRFVFRDVFALPGIQVIPLIPFKMFHYLSDFSADFRSKFATQLKVRLREG